MPEISECHVTWGPDHEPTKGSQVYGFWNSHGLRQKNRVKKAAGGEDTSPHGGYRDLEGAGTTAVKVTMREVPQGLASPSEETP